jgi:ABC-type uncharacterized transport system permease subunit
MEEQQIVTVVIAAGLIAGLLFCVLPALARMFFGEGRDPRSCRREGMD